MELEKAIDQEAENKAKDYAEKLCSCYTNDYYGFYNGFISGYNFAKQQNTTDNEKRLEDKLTKIGAVLEKDLVKEAKIRLITAVMENY